jgi:hypothetical protein
VSKRQTRRSISFRAEVFERIRRHCAKLGVSMTSWLEQRVTVALDDVNEPTVEREEAVRAVRPKPKQPEPPDHGHHFTF